jgi:uncharacterized protein (DUF362 family)
MDVQVGRGIGMPVVSIVRLEGDHIEDAVRHAIDLVGGLDAVIPAGSSVLLKPNVVSPSPSGSGRITDARVTGAVARAVLERNPGRVVIGEGSSVGYDFPGRKDSMHCLEISGTADVARRLGVERVDLNRDEQVQVRAENAFVMESFAVARAAWDADVIVDLPVIKTHVRTGITCGLKNMKGVLPGDWKKRTHQLGLDRGIVDLNRVVKPHFTVVDAIVGMEGTWQYPEDCVRLGCIVAGADVVAVDAVCATIAGFDVEQILHVQLAAQEGLGVADLERIEVRGEAIAKVARRFIPYHEAAQDRFGAAKIVERNACTGCMGEIVSTFIYLKEAGYRDRLADLTLIIGMPDELPEMCGTPVVVGKCARAYRHSGVYVPGCPPHGVAITDGACEALGIDSKVVHAAIAALHDF